MAVVTADGRGGSLGSRAIGVLHPGHARGCATEGRRTSRRPSPSAQPDLQRQADRVPVCDEGVRSSAPHSNGAAGCAAVRSEATTEGGHMRRSVTAVLVGLFTVLALGVGSVGAKPAIPLNAEQE